MPKKSLRTRVLAQYVPVKRWITGERAEMNAWQEAHPCCVKCIPHSDTRAKKEHVKKRPCFTTKNLKRGMGKSISVFRPTAEHLT